jgi:hypothetical protein
MEAARYANRQSDRAQTSVNCGFDSHSCQSNDSGWCSSRRSVKPLPSNCEAVGERFNSFTTHCKAGSVVYRFRTPPSHGGEAGSIPAGAAPNERLFPGATGVRPALIKPACPARYRGLGHAGGLVLGRVSYARMPRFDSRARNHEEGVSVIVVGINGTVRELA